MARRIWMKTVVSSCLLAVSIASGAGCRLRPETIDAELARRAATSLQDWRQFPVYETGEHLEEKYWTVGDVIIGELLAIFPGVLVHGLGHHYAGDHATGRQIGRVGAFGYLMLAVGGGTAAGGISMLENSDSLEGQSVGLVLAIIGTGVSIGGLPHFFTAWFYDMIDTPRAVMSGGEPPEDPGVLRSFDLFGSSIP